MKKIGDLMKEAGFNAQAPDSVKEAYIKHLIKAATGVSLRTPSEKKEMAENPEKVLHFKSPQQLSFDFAEEKSPPPKGGKKASTF